MLVGNDVVDLGDPENQPEAIHPRFDERVFTADERARLTDPAWLTDSAWPTDAAAAHRLRWVMWAAKESAFKVARKLEPEVRFLPRRFAVRFGEGSRAVVRHATGSFDVSFIGAREWVHAVAWPSDRSSAAGALEPGHGIGSALGGRVRRSLSSAAEASMRVRAMARSAVGSLLGIEPAEIEISMATGVPTPRWRDQFLPVDISMSHHGRFLACVWRAPIPTADRARG